MASPAYAAAVGGTPIPALMARGDSYATTNAVVAYFCRERALTMMIEKANTAEPGALDVQMGQIMDLLEATRASLSAEPESKEFYEMVEREAVNSFVSADKAYRGNAANKASITGFLNAGFLLEALVSVNSNVWAGLPKYAEMSKYAKSSARAIADALKQHVQPVPPSGGATADDSMYDEMFNAIGGMSVQPPHVSAPANDVPMFGAAPPAVYGGAPTASYGAPLPPPPAAAVPKRDSPPASFNGAQIPTSYGAPPAASFPSASFGAQPPASFGAQLPASFHAPPSAAASSLSSYAGITGSYNPQSAVPQSVPTSTSPVSSSGGGHMPTATPQDPILRDAMEYTRFAMAAIREGNKAKAVEFLFAAAKNLQS